MADIKLTAAMTTNLLALQNTQKLMDSTQQKLATGLKVNSALDNPSSYYSAEALNRRASDLEGLLDSMGQGIQTLKTVDETITSATKFVEQAKAIAEQASEKLAADASADVSDLAASYSKVLDKMNDLISNASYKGINLLKGDSGQTAGGTATNSASLTVYFQEGARDSNTAKLTLQGVDATAAGLGFTADGADDTVSGEVGTYAAGTAVVWADLGAANGSINEALKAMETLQGFASGFSTDYNIISNREDFTSNLINVLTEGADKLTLADMNEEAANMLALQTRQQLGVNSLSLASQAQQAVLKLF